MKIYTDGGEALLEAFRSLGVDYIFSSPGSEWAPVWEALARQTHEQRPGPRYFDLWHETVAVGMATGYALVTRRPQAVLLHAGAGLLQGTCAIHGALLSNAPMLILSSESITYGERPGVDPGSQWYRNLSIVGGPHGLVQPIVKWASQVPSIETLYEMAIRTTELGIRSPAGPCYLNVPVEVLLEPWSPPKFRRATPPAGKRISPRMEIDRIAAMLRDAKEPVVITETAGRDSRAFAALVELCNLLAMPVVEPQSAVCTNFPRSNPLHQGATAEAFMKTADLVLLVNCRAPWYPPSEKPANARTVVVDEVPQRPHIVYQVLHADAYLEGETAETLAMLVDSVRALGVDDALVADRRRRHAATYVARQKRSREAERAAESTDGSIDPISVVKELRDRLGTTAVFVDETITHSRLIQQHLELDQPGRYHYVQGGLGQGIAVALGVKLASPDRLVVLTIGDGTLMYNPIVPSLAAARDLGLPLLIVVFNNKQYLSMKFNHLRAYPDGVAVTTDRFYGVNLATQPDLAAFATPFGMTGVTVTQAGELRQAFDTGLAAVSAGRSAIINVMTKR